MKRACRYCATTITEQNERLDCPFGNKCTLCEICHRAVEIEARNEGLRMHTEWVSLRSSDALFG